MRFIKKLLVVVLIINIILIGYVVGVTIKMLRSPVMEYAYLHKNINYLYQETNLTKSLEEYKQNIRDLCNVKHIYFNKEISNKTTYGKASPIIRSVFVDEMKLENNLELFIWTYTHELMHIKHYSKNERYTNYLTFVTLYESNNNELVQVALNQFVEMQYRSREYDCSYQIYNYLILNHRNNLNRLTIEPFTENVEEPIQIVNINKGESNERK